MRDSATNSFPEPFITDPKREDGFARVRTGISWSLATSRALEPLGWRSDVLNVGELGDFTVSVGRVGSRGARSRCIWETLCETVSSTFTRIGEGGSAVVIYTEMF